MPGVITSRAVARPASKPSCARPLQAVGHHANQPVVLSNRNGVYVMLAHQFREFGDRSVWTDPIDSLVHHVFDFHDRPPLLDLRALGEIQPRFPRRLALYNGSSANSVHAAPVEQQTWTPSVLIGDGA